MKTKLLLGIATAAILTACSNDELVSVNTDSSNIIGFSTFVNKSTRATDIIDDNISNFAVNGYTKASTDDAKWQPIFLNEEVTKSDDGSWQYANLQYWEDGNSYHFHAIAPYGKTATDSLGIQSDVKHWEYEVGATTVSTEEIGAGDNDENSATTTTPDYSKAKITFTNIKKGDSDYEAAGEQDLIYAYKYETGAASGNQKVQFDFKHLLSRVKFQFKGAASNPASIKIYVTEVTLEGTHSDGSIEIEAGKDAAWALGSSTELPLYFGYAGATDAAGDFTKTALSSEVSTIETAHKYVIPDVENSVRYKASFKCEIYADVKNGNPKKYTVISEKNDLPAVTMKEGYSYVYQITLDASTDESNNLIKPILFNVTEVKDWGDNYITVPSSVTETVNITSTNSAIQILGNSFDKTQIEEMYIDGKKLDTKVSSYTFDTTGGHSIKIVLKDNFTNASHMFDECTNYTSIDLSEFDTSKVTDMSFMFYDCTGLTELDLSNLDTSNVTDMQEMFAYCKNIKKLDVSSLNTSNVTNMHRMFLKNESLENLVGLSSFDTSQVTIMSCMFGYCHKLKELDLSSWNTAKVTDFSYMFYLCYDLISLIMTNGGSNTANTTEMFYQITSNGTFTYNSEYNYTKIIDVIPSSWTTKDINPNATSN